MPWVTLTGRLNESIVKTKSQDWFWQFSKPELQSTRYDIDIATPLWRLDIDRLNIFPSARRFRAESRLTGVQSVLKSLYSTRCTRQTINTGIFQTCH
jgi:hypothetical protein